MLTESTAIQLKAIVNDKSGKVIKELEEKKFFFLALQS